MIYYIPFFFFSFLLIILLRKKRQFDLSCYILSIFAVSAFFSILRENEGLRVFVAEFYEISVEATFVYCALIALCVLPFAIYPSPKLSNLQQYSNPKVLKYLAIFAFIYLLIIVVFSATTVFSILTGNLGELRFMVYGGESEYHLFDNFPPLIKSLLTIPNFIFGNSYILLLLAFVAYVCPLPKKYAYMLFFSSLCDPIKSIIVIDRSHITYWIMALGACIILFKDSISIRKNKHLLFFVGGILSVLAIYLFMVSDSRADYTEGDSSVSLIDYLGQSYINFAYFYDNFDAQDSYFQQYFPFLYLLFSPDTPRGLELMEIIEIQEGIKTSVFYTFLGYAIIAGGKTMLFSFVIVYLIITFTGLYYLSPKRYFNILDFIYFYFVTSSIMFLGPFYYFYSSPLRTFSTIALFLILFIAQRVRYK